MIQGAKNEPTIRILILNVSQILLRFRGSITDFMPGICCGWRTFSRAGSKLDSRQREWCALKLRPTSPEAYLDDSLQYSSQFIISVVFGCEFKGLNGRVTMGTRTFASLLTISLQSLWIMPRPSQPSFVRKFVTHPACHPPLPYVLSDFEMTSKFRL